MTYLRVHMPVPIIKQDEIEKLAQSLDNINAKIKSLLDQLIELCKEVE